MTRYQGVLRHTRRCGNGLVDIQAYAQAEVKAKTVCVIFDDVTV